MPSIIPAQVIAAISAAQEKADFLDVYKVRAKELGLDPDPYHPLHYYDYERLYQDTGDIAADETGHFPSAYKKFGHPRLILGEFDTRTGSRATMQAQAEQEKALAAQDGVVRKYEAKKKEEKRKRKPDMLSNTPESNEAWRKMILGKNLYKESEASK